MKKIIALLGSTLTVVLFLTACSSAGKDSSSEASSGASAKTSERETAGSEAYHKITAKEAKEMMDAGSVTIVDVRTAEEYAEKHIPDALLLPVESIGNEMPEALPDKNAVLLLHCRTGVRSKQAADKLAALGYTNVYDFGGIVDWTYETESGDSE